MLGSVAMFLRPRRGWLLGAVLFAAGCLSPTLPLPPPGDPVVTSTETAGLVRLTGTVQQSSDVFAKNLRTQLIFGQHTDSGNYDFTIEAAENDSISLWYEHDQAESPTTEFLIELPQTTP